MSKVATCQAYLVMAILVAATVIAALLLTGCTINTIKFEEGAVRVADEVKVLPGQGGDSSDTGSTGGATAGGEGKLSPGGSNLQDGWLQVSVLIQQGGETPSTTTPTVTAEAPIP